MNDGDDNNTTPAAPPTDSGGMTASTPDGAGYSAEGTAPNASTSDPATSTVAPAAPPPTDQTPADAPPAAQSDERDNWVAANFGHHPNDSVTDQGPAGDAGNQPSPAASVNNGSTATLAVAGVGLPLIPGAPTGPPMPLDPSIVDTVPWTPITGPAAAGGDAAVTGAATTAAETTATAVATDAAAVSTADAALATAVAVEEGALATDAATVAIPGVDVVTVPIATIVAVGAGVVIGGILAYKSLTGDDTPPAQAPASDQTPAPMQNPAPAGPVTAPSPPVPAPMADPTPQPQAGDPPNNDDPMQAGTWRGNPDTVDDDPKRGRRSQNDTSGGTDPVGSSTRKDDLRPWLGSFLSENFVEAFMWTLRDHDDSENRGDTGSGEEHPHLHAGSSELIVRLKKWLDANPDAKADLREHMRGKYPDDGDFADWYDTWGT